MVKGKGVAQLKWRGLLGIRAERYDQCAKRVQAPLSIFFGLDP